MENLNYRNDKDTLYIELKGRIDASNADELERTVDGIRSANPDKRTVFDADKLEYISSAGLRVVLRLRKQEPELSIINTPAEVYSVFEMTGFTEMINIEKTYPRINIDGCEFIAKGANGAVYRYDDETIVKEYFSKDALDEIKQERENARKAFVMGVNTAIPYGIVRIGDSYGSVTELLNASSLTKLIRENPQELTAAVEHFVTTLKLIHSIDLKKGELPDSRDTVIDWAEFLKDHLEKPHFDKLMSLMQTLPESTHMIHGDYHTNNIMLQNGEALIIDLDTLAAGSGIIELGSVFNAYVGFGEYDGQSIRDFFGIDNETGGRFWKLVLTRYIDSDDPALLTAAEDKAKVIGYTRIVRRCIRRGLEEKEINYYKQRLIEAISRVDTLEL